MTPGILKKKTRLDARRPLAQKSIEALDRWFDVALTYSSNAIEGNTLTHAETALVIEKGLTIGGKTLREHLEVADHHAALQVIRAMAEGDAPLSEGDVLRIHEMALARSLPAEAGRYATAQRRILGSATILPGPHKIPVLMADFGAWLAASHASPETAFEAHFRLVAIHPFADGNGRTARLLMNLVLLRAGYPPVSIEPVQRKAYIDALELRSTKGGAAAYDALMAERLADSLDQYLAAIDAELGE